MHTGLDIDRDSFFDQFTTQFYSVGDELKVTEQQRQDAITLCQQSDQRAALGCMQAFATTDFRGDLAGITVPTLVIHGDGVVPLEGSGAHTYAAIPQPGASCSTGHSMAATSATPPSSTRRWWPFSPGETGAAPAVGSDRTCQVAARPAGCWPSLSCVGWPSDQEHRHRALVRPAAVLGLQPAHGRRDTPTG